MENCTDFAEKSHKKAAFIHNLISTSYHEAGHAVYGLLHLMKVELVQIMKEKNNFVNGLTHFDYISIYNDTAEDIKLSAIYAEIGLRYAGLTAEKYHFKNISGSDKFPMFLKNGSSEDTLHAANLIKLHNLAPPGKKRYVFKKKFIAYVLSRLQNNWGDVNLVAHGLFQKKRLYYTDLKSLLTKKSENKEFWREQFKAIDYIYKSGALDDNKLRIILAERGAL